MTTAGSDPLARLEAVLASDVVAAIVELVEERITTTSTTAHGGGSPWLALDEAAAYLRVSPRTLERSIARGRLRSTTLGRRRLLHRDDLDAFARAATAEEVAPTTPRRRR